MFDFVPLEFYTTIYYQLLLLIAIIFLFQGFVYDFRNNQVIRFNRVFIWLIFVGLVFYMGLRPISGYYFGDMGNYARYFKDYKEGYGPVIKKDFVFNYFLKFTSQFINVDSFFLLVSFLYILPCYLVAKKYTGSYWYLTFFMFIGSMSFWSYGTNGIRNGLATSVFLLALYFYHRKVLLILFIVLSYGIHNSMMITIVAFLLTTIIKNPRWYIYIWLLAIPVSLVLGNSFQVLFASLIEDERASNYLIKGNVNNDQFSSTGFRWDFLIYSFLAVFAGYFFIFIKKIVDPFYIHLYGTYLISNAFWVIVIKANFSNRFAYLSWFLMALIIAYPLLKYKIWKDQFKWVSIITFFYFFISYFLYFKSK